MYEGCLDTRLDYSRILIRGPSLERIGLGNVSSGYPAFYLLVTVAPPFVALNVSTAMAESTPGFVPGQASTALPFIDPARTVKPVSVSATDPAVIPYHGPGADFVRALWTADWRREGIHTAARETGGSEASGDQKSRPGIPFNFVCAVGARSLRQRVPTGETPRGFPVQAGHHVPWSTKAFLRTHILNHLPRLFAKLILFSSTEAMVVSVLRRLLASPPRYLVLQEEHFFILTGNAVDVCYFAPAETPRSTEQGIGERAVAGAEIRRMDPIVSLFVVRQSSGAFEHIGPRQVPNLDTNREASLQQLALLSQTQEQTPRSLFGVCACIWDVMSGMWTVWNGAVNVRVPFTLVRLLGRDFTMRRMFPGDRTAHCGPFQSQRETRAARAWIVHLSRSRSYSSPVYSPGSHAVGAEFTGGHLKDMVMRAAMLTPSHSIHYNYDGRQGSTTFAPPNHCRSSTGSSRVPTSTLPRTADVRMDSRDCLLCAVLMLAYPYPHPEILHLESQVDRTDPSPEEFLCRWCEPVFC
ncbi:hypothetical protein GLOTRDRAFT_96779 [Gloeophyllum trabeum ATCC 11539]|uniref:Uncharacterized protein n=1 Tax=Gloeophyllum trabeum (strain ATCC 11539 / FP-39264 / Madison 617) TaxID=670483 RepID=S7PTT6_GLOTA|nr:uncharacterized protein GLOTRDRAFT_96779 [Gloeophyllum trabeum ATCC 11539]EPQ50858.1 hypothetical protein GLOTRDRAFT_96779 [Gloeophyllum trabeum ATCC 11539]